MRDTILLYESNKRTEFEMILGISLSHDASVAVTTADGRVVAAIGEERLSRVKNHWGIPKLSIERVSQMFDFKTIVIGSHFYLSRRELEIFEAQLQGNPSNPSGKYLPPFPGFTSSFSKYPVKRAMELLILTLLDKRQNKEHIEFVWVRHHDAHTGAALPLYPNSKFLVFSFDGHGDGLSSQISKVSNIKGRQKVKILAQHKRKHSLGSIYQACTEVYNFRPNSHEGKITGLSATGVSSPAIQYLSKHIRVRKGTHTVRIFQNSLLVLISKIFNKFGFQSLRPRTHYELVNNAKQLTSGYGDLAFAIQKILEETLLQIVSHFATKYQLDKVALTGGLFANVVFNAKIAQVPGVSDVRIFPNMGDGGLSLGGIYWHLFSQGKLSLEALPSSMFLAPETGSEDQDYFSSLLIDSQLTIQKMDKDETIAYVSKALVLGKIVGLHRGKMEFGPRALCNRTILVDPRKKEVNKSVNLRLRRTEFMPFAPVVTQDSFNKYFDPPQEDIFPFYYMTMVCNVKPEWRQRLAAVTHVDNTARPQVINKDDDEFMYDILKSFEKETGIACLVNTSFNLHEEPINFTLSDSVSALKKGAVDILIISGYAIEVNRV